MFSASAVLPMEGRAARITSSPRVQAAGHLIELRKARAEAADALAGIEKGVRAAGKAFDDTGGRRQLLVGGRLAQLQQRFFGRRQDLVRLLFADQAAVDDPLRAEDQLAQRGLVLDDADVAIEVGDLRQSVVERDQVTQAVHRFELALLHQLFGQRDAVDALAAAVQILHAAVNAAVLLEAKIFGR